MRVEDLFPPCSSEDCPHRGRHKHILEHQQQAIDSEAKYLLMSGGYGSAKTYVACVICFLLSLHIPGNFGFIGRTSYDKLHDSTQKVFMEVVERYERLTGDIVARRENRGGWYHRLELYNGSQVIFRETKDLGRHLGPEYGWFLLDEVIEMPEAVFTKLMGRLRLPRAGRFLKGILLTNPPDRRHWTVKWFGDTPGVKAIEDKELRVTTRFQYIKSRTSDNKHLPPGYLASLKLLDPNEYRRVVSGELGFTSDGPPVYPQFANGIHVGVPDFLSGVPLRRGWDFGFRHPACVWGQTRRCHFGALHTRLLHETDGQQIEGEAFGAHVMLETRKAFPRAEPVMTQDAGDAAGAAVSDKGPGPIIRLAQPPYSLQFRFQKIANIDPGLDFIRKLLRLGVCKCGEPVIQVHRSMRGVIDGFLGGYHMPPKAKPNDKPVKDGFYDDFMDAVRYFFWNFVRPEMAGHIIDEIERANRIPGHDDTPAHGWMEERPTPDAVAAEIADAKRRARELTGR